RLTDLYAATEEIKDQIQEELQLLSENWQTRSNTKWIEEGERSTKYFFTRYKIRHSSSCSTRIKNPENPTASSQPDTLAYIKNFYESLYRKEPIDTQKAEDLLIDTPTISQDQNTSLVKPFTEEEVS